MNKPDHERIIELVARECMTALNSHLAALRDPTQDEVRYVLIQISGERLWTLDTLMVQILDYCMEHELTIPRSLQLTPSHQEL